MNKVEFYVIAHNIRSAYNVGAILRTADGLGIDKLFLTGYTPAPFDGKSTFLTKAQKMIAKTALGAEKSVIWQKSVYVGSLLKKLQKQGFKIVALEQAANSIKIGDYQIEGKIVLILGNEPKGIEKKLLKHCQTVLEIPMRGKKNSFNVSIAFAIAGYDICSKIKVESTF